MKRRFLIAAIVVLALLAGAAWLRLGPVPEIDRAKLASVTVVDRNGEVLYEPLASSGARTEWMHADAIPANVADATLAAEDHRFRSHIGIDPISVARAVVHNMRRLRVVEGGSTITQQVAKLLLGSRERTLVQKAREAVVALRLEHRYSKDEILALYLNLAPYGNRINGIARASRAYFGAAPDALTPAQAAFLASLPQRPSAFNPLRNENAAMARQRAVLARMHLSADDYKHARAERLRFDRGEQPVVARHFVERVLSGAAGASPGGFSRDSAGEGARRSNVIRTTLDANLQREIAGIIAARKDDLLRHGAHSVAVAVLDNESGEWLAWEGSGDYFGERFGGAIDGVVTARQPGSTLKPFTYALAFERGYSPATVLADVPSHFPTAEAGIVYTPRNYDGKYRGPLPVRSALAGSENVPAVAMLAQLGPSSLLRVLRNAGFRSLDRTADYYGLGLTLGDAEVTLEQLVTAYASFARGGKAVQPVMLLDQKHSTERRVFTQKTAFWITDILSDANAREYAFGSGGSLDFPFPVAVKTGTSQAYRDNWTVGYTREVTVGVWVGNFDRDELRGSSGVTGAAPIFNSVMLAAMKRARGRLPIGDMTPIVEHPAQLESLPVCALSGLRPSPWCPSIEHEWVDVTQPAQFCSWHHEGRTDYPPEYREWARKNGQLPAAAPQLATQHETPLRITNPADGATYMIDPTLRSDFQLLRLRATATSRVSWHVDDKRVSDEWPLRPGRHTIQAVDEDGRADRVQIYVK
ncbi:MAG TPA: penicillin-binding protein 1C [Thermoanaerobaculia bacterium]|nr:penicillin-binding protein 1C [Thermoanaerobaculia bacterium]